MRVPLVIDELHELGDVPDYLDLMGGEFCISRRIDPVMVARCCRLGYLPMGDDTYSSSILLIKCHRQRMVLRFPELHVSRSTRRMIARGDFHLHLDRNFDEVLEAIDAVHDRVCWLIPPLAAVFRRLHHQPEEGVSLHSVELRTGAGELVAGEVGYQCGPVYTSLSGFHFLSGAGTVQMVSLARVLADAGMRFWDLGMDIEYKRALGAVPVPRRQFLTEYRREVSTASPALPPGPHDCRILHISDRRATGRDGGSGSRR